MTALAPTLQAFFTDRLIRQRHASSHTVAAYRDTLRTLLNYTATQTGVPPSRLDFDQLDAPAIGAFLDHLEHERGNSVRTRNARLAATHCLFRFAALLHPEHAASISRVLAIPPKRCDQALITYLTEQEITALLAAPNPDTRTGRRDRILLQLAIQTGLRISELTGLTIADIHLGVGAHIGCHGKGRKNRITPLTAETTHALRAWLAEHVADANAPLFPGRSGQRLSRDAIEHRIATHAQAAARACPSLRSKRVTTYVLRHTTAMRLLHAGIDIAVIALWLGHESIETTRIYLFADLDLKQKAIARTRQLDNPPGRYRPPDKLIAWLEAL
jgi:site-specific recombinase XerD